MRWMLRVVHVMRVVQFFSTRSLGFGIWGGYPTHLIFSRNRSPGRIFLACQPPIQANPSRFGRCDILDDRAGQLEVTCKTSDQDYTKHFLGLSDNVTYFAEQLEMVDVSVFHHRITFKPQAIVPDIDFRGSTEELLENASEFDQ